jgi:colicin import membrane protein
MAEMRRGSVLFSLSSGPEPTRGRDDDLLTRPSRWGGLPNPRRVEVEMAARIEAEHRARLEQEALLRAEDARHRAEAATRREEAARCEAVRIAALERARMEAEQQAKIALLTQQHAHERELAALEREQQRQAHRRLGYGAAALAAAILGTLASVYFGQIRPEAARTERAEVAAAAARDARLWQLRADLERANQRVEEARRALEQAKRSGSTGPTGDE